MNRNKAVLVVGAFTGLVIITWLALGLGNVGAVAYKGTTVPEEAIQLPLPQSTNLKSDAAVQAWQQYSAELEQTLRTMQARENTYQSEIDMANQTILQLQDQLNAANATSNSGATYTDDDGYAGHEEHEAHEEDDD